MTVSESILILISKLFLIAVKVCNLWEAYFDVVKSVLQALEKFISFVVELIVILKKFIPGKIANISCQISFYFYLLSLRKTTKRKVPDKSSNLDRSKDTCDEINKLFCSWKRFCLFFCEVFVNFLVLCLCLIAWILLSMLYWIKNLRNFAARPFSTSPRQFDFAFKSKTRICR